MCVGVEYVSSVVMLCVYRCSGELCCNVVFTGVMVSCVVMCVYRCRG